MAKELTVEQKAIIEKMDIAALVAKAELAELTKNADAKAIGAWMKKYYLQAGYKRLAKALIDLAGKANANEKANMEEAGNIKSKGDAIRELAKKRGLKIKDLKMSGETE